MAKKICVKQRHSAGNVRGGDLQPLDTTSSSHWNINVIPFGPAN